MKNKFVYALLSLLVSFGLWLYVITVVSPESENTFYNIPVTLSNETALHDKGLMVVTEKIPTVTLKLSGNRTDLNKLNVNNIMLVADLSRIYGTGEQQISYTITYPGDVSPNAIEILSQTPRLITLEITERAVKEIPIKVEYSGKVKEGFTADKENLILDKTVVNAIGPASVMDQIAYAQVTVDLEGRTETINQTYRYTLVDAAGNAVDASQVTTDVKDVLLTLKIQRYKKIPLSVTVNPGGGATSLNTTITLTDEQGNALNEILISGSEQLLEGLDALVLGEINLGMISEDTTLDFTISAKLPEGITNLSGEDTVRVHIDLPTLETTTVKVSEFRAKNVPEGMTAKIEKQTLTVTVRGPKSQITALVAALKNNPNLIVGEVDFTDGELNDPRNFKTQFVINGYDSVGVMNAYTVFAELVAAEG